MKKIMCKQIALLMVFLLLLFTRPAMGWQQPCPGCCAWSGYDCVSSSSKCSQCEDCIKHEIKHTCTCECNVECGCDGKTCPGCCKCEDCACVDDSSKCTGCKSCSIFGCACFDDNRKCPENHECCNGVCCSGNDCKYCDVNDNCVSYCDPSKCHECDGLGHCEVCGGDPNETCCDGTCQPKCEEVGSETLCGSEKDTPCRSCVGILGDCFNYKAQVYSNQTIYNCSGGCPGECDDEYPSPPCYDEYFCNNWIHYNFAECTSMSETGPVPLECYDAGQPWGCTRCQQGDYSRTLYVLSRRCQ